MPEKTKSVLFVCTHNSARSQMAEDLLDSLYGNKYKAFSAGTEPSVVNPHAVQVMSEIGIDISKHRSKDINEFLEQKFRYTTVSFLCPYSAQNIALSCKKPKCMTI